MLFSRREALRIYTSSSLFLNARAWTLASSSSRYLSWNNIIRSYDEFTSTGSTSRSSSSRSSTSSWCSSSINSRFRSISTSGAAAVLRTSSGVASRTTAVVVGGSRQQAWPATLAPSAPRATALVMGPVYVAAGVTDKINSIRDALRDTSSPSQGQGQGRAADGLQVIMDFDLTMTAPGSEQCHHMFETSPALPPDLRARLAPFFTGEMEVSSREEWWEKFHDVLIGDRLTKAQVSLVAKGASLTLRSGTSELMVLLHQLGVPLLIVSAGISDIVEESLRLRGLLLGNVTVRANTMLFDEHGKLESFRESPPVHSRNKQHTAEREKEYFAAHPGRRCIVLVGDKPGDADVNHGVAPDDRCLKIGFFDHSHEHPHPDLPPLPPPLAPVPPASSTAAAAAAAAASGSGSMAAGAACAAASAAAAATMEVVVGVLPIPEAEVEAGARARAEASAPGTGRSGSRLHEGKGRDADGEDAAITVGAGGGGGVIGGVGVGGEGGRGGGSDRLTCEEIPNLGCVAAGDATSTTAAAVAASTVSTAAAAAATAEGSFWATPARFTGRPGSQGGGELLVSSFVGSSSSSVDTGDGGTGSGRVSVVKWLAGMEEMTQVQSILAERVRSIVPGSRAPAIDLVGTTTNNNQSNSKNNHKYNKHNNNHKNSTNSNGSDYVRQAAGEAGLGAGGGGAAEGRVEGQGSERSASASVGMESVAAEEMLRAYGDSFDIVACGGHPMDIVTDFVRHFAWLDDASAG